jgi:hypothetical protein
MQQQDQSEQIDTLEQSGADRAVEASRAGDGLSSREEIPAQSPDGRLDWPALLAALAVAAFFALTARFNSQPAPSYVPAAVFSATGCGLLVTAIHKLRSRAGAGLREAALGGLGMALFQFLMTFTYPGVFTTITSMPEYSRAFFLTWGLVALFAIVLSLAGATIGHLAFSPLRPAQKNTQEQSAEDEEELEDEEQSVEAEERDQLASPSALPEARQTASSDEALEEEEEESYEAEDEDELSRQVPTGAQTRHVWINYAITVLLLALLPMMAGYVFAASYDFLLNTMNVNSISPALYPTLSLLSGLLPWRLANPISLSGQNGTFIVFTLLWRIPDSVLGNPNLFDVQALESQVFSATGLALLLITMYNRDNSSDRRRSAPWGVFVSLEMLLGLLLILPTNLWLLRGLEGVLQMGGIIAALPTIQLINPLLFTLNLLTGALFCLIIGLIVRRQHQLWTAPRALAPAVSEKRD